MKSFLEYIQKLYEEKKQIVLLSWFYAAVALVCFFIAGICALVDQSFGISVLIVPIVALTALCANITVWALIKLLVAHIEEYKASKDAKASKDSKSSKDDKEVKDSKKKA